MEGTGDWTHGRVCGGRGGSGCCRWSRVHICRGTSCGADVYPPRPGQERGCSLGEVMRGCVRIRFGRDAHAGACIGGLDPLCRYTPVFRIHFSPHHHHSHLTHCSPFPICHILRAAQQSGNGCSSAGGENLFSSWDLNTGAADGFVRELQLWQAGGLVGIWQEEGAHGPCITPVV